MNSVIKNILRIVTMLFIFCAGIAVFAEQLPGDISFNLRTEAAIPGHLLQPGKYLLRRVNSGNATTFEILRYDTLGLVGYLHVIPVERMQVGETEIDFSAPDQTGVRMIQAWYGPGDTNGYQVMYSKKDVRSLDEVAQSQVQAGGSPAGLP